MERYPKGKFRGQAESRLKVLNKFASIRDIKFGNYYALVIGNNDYKNLPKLKTAVSDAKAVAEVLEKNYGFKVKMMLNVSALEIIDAARAALEIDRAAATLSHNTSPQLVLTDLWRSLRRGKTAIPPDAGLAGVRRW